jgi:ABC-type glycerol-3-phosphate transport system substrate-binding protein
MGGENQRSALIAYLVNRLAINQFMSRGELLVLTNEVLSDLELFAEKPYFQANERPGAFLIRVFIDDMLFRNQMLNDLVQYVPIPLPTGADGSRSVIPGFGYAIMSNSEHKEEAMDFIRFLADKYDPQILLSTRRDRVDRYIQYVESLPEYWFFETPFPPIDEMKTFLNNYDKAFEAFNTVFIYDFSFYHSLADTATAFFDGALTKQAAANELADKLWLRNNQ